jgi:hypothetical protein
MPIMNPTAGVKSVAEITSGGSNERSVDGGQLADVSVRNWRVILESPAAAYDIQEAIRVWIGDTHPVNGNLPCVSISEKVEGESRVVRVITATYRTTPGADPENDPNTQPPDIRPATYSITSSLMEVPATSWRKVEAAQQGGGNANGPPRRDGQFGNNQWWLNPGPGEGFCWVAREAYGADDPRWLLFRAWLTADAPRWLFEVYAARGERFAAWIHDKPLVKAAVRSLMDIAIKSRSASNQKGGHRWQMNRRAR